ncbi:MAG: hypothetical protein OEZ01_03785 [Candidatus Heimdallarchaeota archaeon]|nr:hypothetical protein [Candidatus Heimdallarchaeota archaeon]MDH5645100.1 hypothetical protein [Candidatus Heimdallarchaeota archaeon]
MDIEWEKLIVEEDWQTLDKTNHTNIAVVIRKILNFIDQNDNSYEFQFKILLFVQKYYINDLDIKSDILRLIKATNIHYSLKEFALKILLSKLGASIDIITELNFILKNHKQDDFLRARIIDLITGFYWNIIDKDFILNYITYSLQIRRAIVDYIGIFYKDFEELIVDIIENEQDNRLISILIKNLNENISSKLQSLLITLLEQTTDIFVKIEIIHFLRSKSSENNIQQQLISILLDNKEPYLVRAQSYQSLMDRSIDNIIQGHLDKDETINDSFLLQILQIKGEASWK